MRQENCCSGGKLIEDAVGVVGHNAPATSQPWNRLWLWLRLSKEMLLVFVLVEVVAEIPDAVF